MKPKSFGLIGTIKNIKYNIQIYKSVAQVLRELGMEMYYPWVVDSYPYSLKLLAKKTKQILTDAEDLVKNSDLIVSVFSDKSRTVYLQTIIALENHVPTLCLVQKKNKKNYPKSLEFNDSGLVSTYYFDKISDIEEILVKYLEKFKSKKRYYKTILDTETIKKMKLISNKLNISNSELIQRLIYKEFDRVF